MQVSTLKHIRESFPKFVFQVIKVPKLVIYWRLQIMQPGARSVGALPPTQFALFSPFTAAV